MITPEGGRRPCRRLHRGGASFLRNPLSALALASSAERARSSRRRLQLSSPASRNDRGANVRRRTGTRHELHRLSEIAPDRLPMCADDEANWWMELGGHAPLSFWDANVEKAADIAIAAKFATSGQDCLAAIGFTSSGPFSRHSRKLCRTNCRPKSRLRDGAGHRYRSADARTRRRQGRGTGRGRSEAGRPGLPSRQAPAPPGRSFSSPTLLTDVPDDAPHHAR